jgi:YidC/Oxa1 family membrane protein insertase
MFEFIAKPLASALAFFYNLIPNYGVAIILLTVLVMVLLTPFTIKSTRSMLAMQRLQPELKRLQAQHKNDRQALNEAMMAFYKEHNVNPLSGCLPMLLQMPVFFGLYEAIRGLTHNPPQNLSHTSKLFTSLCPDFNGTACANGAQDFVVQMKVLGIDLAKSVGSDHGSFAKALPYYVLIALTTATQYYQQRQISNRNPQAAQANPQMQMMQKFFPIIFLLIYIKIPAAVVLYFLVSNLLRIAQQGAMWRWDPKLAAEVSAEVREVESKTKVIDARSRQVPKGKGSGQAKGGRDDKQPDKPSDKQPPPELERGGNAKGNGKPSGSSSSPPPATGGKPPNPRAAPGPGNRSTGAGPASRQRGRARRGR